MQICFDKNYPEHLVKALQMIHSMQTQEQCEFHWGKKINDEDYPETVVFLFDRKRRGLDVTTEKYFEIGFRVFAFKATLPEKLSLFELALTVFSIWPKVIEIINNRQKEAFVYVYSYKRKWLKKVK